MFSLHDIQFVIKITLDEHIHLHFIHFQRGIHWVPIKIENVTAFIIPMSERQTGISIPLINTNEHLNACNVVHTKHIRQRKHSAVNGQKLRLYLIKIDHK